MIDVLSETEGEPSSYPSLPGSFTTPAAAVWSRLEGWIRHRWNERTVTWILRGPGTWQPRLKPASIDQAERWDGDTWQTVTMQAGPIGYDLDAATYRVTATVGETGAPPDAVQTAAARLAGFMDQAATDPTPGYSSVSDGDYSFTRPAGWAARAIHLSGAADLLRGFR